MAVTFYEIQDITPELAIIAEEKGTGEHLWDALEAMQERWFQ